MTEDLAAFFDTATFAIAGTLDGAAVSVILDVGYLEGLEMASAEARAMLPSADVPGTVTSASLLVIGATTYRVRGKPQHDGTGLCTLMLERQP